jgi:hypothetical protein
MVSRDLAQDLTGTLMVQQILALALDFKGGSIFRLLFVHSHRHFEDCGIKDIR